MSYKIKKVPEIPLPETQSLGRGAILLVDDEDLHMISLNLAVKKAFQGRVDVLSVQTYSGALTVMEKNAHRIIGVVSDISYPKDDAMAQRDETERFGLSLSSDIKRLLGNVPLVLESNADYSGSFELFGACDFIMKDDIDEMGPRVFRKSFSSRLVN
jgi:hypothetical protein